MMFPKITDYVELLSEDEVWDAVKDGKEINVLILKGILDQLCFKKIIKYEAGYMKAVSNLNTLRNLIELRKNNYPVIFIVWNNCMLEKGEELDEESN